MAPLLNGGKVLNPQVFQILDRAATEKRFGQRDVRKILRPWLQDREEKTKKQAQELVETLEPEIKIETPEDYDKAAEALKKEAKRKREAAMTETEKTATEAEKKRKAEESKERREEEK